MASPTNRLPLLLLLGIMLSSHLVLADPEPGLRLSRLPPISITDPDRAGLVSFTGGKGFYKHMAREFLVTHNQVRGNLGEPPYLWDRALARYARRWLQKHRADCAIAHSGGPYGENLFWGSGWSWRAAEAVSSWASERFNYNRADNTCLPGKMCGHFTQIVWNSSVKVGCARMECYDGGVIMACNYDPPGNYIGIMLSSHLVLADPEPGLRLSRLPPISITDPDRARLVSFTGGKGFYKHMAREFLVTHNQVRGNLGEPPYLWDRALARYARRWLQKHRADCAIAHSGGPYGENLFWGSGWSWRAAEAVSSWASERFNYNRADNTCLPGKMCGHFTQIVWNSSVKVGCARMECYDGGVIMACNYDPPGNYIGESPFGS